MPRRYPTLKTGQRIDPKTRRFLPKRKPKVGAPTAAGGGTVEEFIRSMYSPRRFARAVLEQAYSGSDAAQQTVLRAVHAIPNSQYDLSKLPFARLQQLKEIFAEARVHGPAPVPAPHPFPVDDDEPEPDAAGEESQTDVAEARFQLDEFNQDALNESLPQKKRSARYRP